MRKPILLLTSDGLAGSISIKNIIASKVLAELLELKNENWTEAHNRRNWFSGAKALSVYSTVCISAQLYVEWALTRHVQYLELDSDHNGMLGKAELAAYGELSLQAPPTCAPHGAFANAGNSLAIQARAR